MRPLMSALVLTLAALSSRPSHAGEAIFSLGGRVGAFDHEVAPSLRLQQNISIGPSDWALRPAINSSLPLISLADPSARDLGVVTTLGAQLTMAPGLSLWPGVGLAFDPQGHATLAGGLDLNVALTDGAVPLGLLTSLGATADGRAWVGAAVSARFGPSR